MRQAVSDFLASGASATISVAPLAIYAAVVSKFGINVPPAVKVLLWRATCVVYLAVFGGLTLVRVTFAGLPWVQELRIGGLMLTFALVLLVLACLLALRTLVISIAHISQAKAQRKIPASDVLSDYHESADKVRCRNIPRLYATATGDSPAVLGLFCPIVAIPMDVFENKSREEIAPILQHELIHVRGLDAYWSLLPVVCWLLFPINVLFLLGARQHALAVEQRCDLEVIRTSGISFAKYSELLIEVATGGTLMRSPGFVTELASEGRHLVERVRLISRAATISISSFSMGLVWIPALGLATFALCEFIEPNIIELSPYPAALSASIARYEILTPILPPTAAGEDCSLEDVSSDGTLVGRCGYRPFVVRPNGVASYLPMPEGRPYADEILLSENGVIAATVSREPAWDGSERVVRWTERFQLESLPEPDESDWSIAVGIDPGGSIYGSHKSAFGDVAYVWPTSGPVRELRMRSSTRATAVGSVEDVTFVVHGEFENLRLMVVQKELLEDWGELQPGAIHVSPYGVFIDSSGELPVVIGGRGHRTVLKPLPKNSTAKAFDSNSAGWIVGASAGSAVIWSPDGAVHDLNQYISAEGWHLTVALGINDLGQIVGTGVKDGSSTPFLLR
ncbi:MAG: M56 family metallopeptidase [Armatimonadetes bacterium]|nr:M56 family metallopeptidase [Armatimonadota bacterium]